jgi:hypothetical protein
MPWWCRWAGWCGHDETTATSSSPLSPLLEFAIGGDGIGWDWAAPKVQVRMHGGAHLLVTEERGRAVGLPGVVGWVGCAQGGVWGWAGHAMGWGWGSHVMTTVSSLNRSEHGTNRLKHGT